MAHDRTAAVGLLTFRDAAARSGCSEELLRRAQASGELLVVAGDAGPESDRVDPGDLAAFELRLLLAGRLES